MVASCRCTATSAWGRRDRRTRPAWWSRSCSVWRTMPTYWLHWMWRKAIGRPISTIVGAAATRRSACRSRCANCGPVNCRPPNLPTAPVMAGGLTFVADRSGAVRALNEQGQLQWTTCTGGPVYYPPTVADGRLFVGSADGRVYAMEAATGRLLWSYRVAPRARWIPVYGKLISTWPVAGGVVVEDGVVYAAAGISHFDGTYVVALDAATGQLRWQNDSSGTLSPEVNCGISLQGELLDSRRRTAVSRRRSLSSLRGTIGAPASVSTSRGPICRPSSRRRSIPTTRCTGSLLRCFTRSGTDAH